MREISSGDDDDVNQDRLVAFESDSRATFLQMLDATIFSLIIGNADAHGKNFSLLHTSAGVALASL